jgi:hypothetical protein
MPALTRRNGERTSFRCDGRDMKARTSDNAARLFCESGASRWEVSEAERREPVSQSRCHSCEIIVLDSVIG